MRTFGFDRSSDSFWSTAGFTTSPTEAITSSCWEVPISWSAISTAGSKSFFRSATRPSANTCGRMCSPDIWPTTRTHGRWVAILGGNASIAPVSVAAMSIASSTVSMESAAFSAAHPIHQRSLPLHRQTIALAADCHSWLQVYVPDRRDGGGSCRQRLRSSGVDWWPGPSSASISWPSDHRAFRHCGHSHRSPVSNRRYSDPLAPCSSCSTNAGSSDAVAKTSMTSCTALRKSRRS